MIKLYDQAIWAFDEAISYSVHANTALARRIADMASDETFIYLQTSDPLIRQLCDLWEIKYEVL